MTTSKTSKTKAKSPAKEKRIIDWESIEVEYRAGIRSLMNIGKEFGVSDAGIIKRAKAEGWTRDLSARIQAKVEEKVSAALVRDSVSNSPEKLATDVQIVEEQSKSIADKVLTQRKDVTTARKVVTALFAELENQLGDAVDDLKNLGLIMAGEDDEGKQRRMSAVYEKVISLPGRTDTARKLAESLRILIELERKVLRIKDDPEVVVAPVKAADPTLSRADAYMRMIGKK